MNRIDRLMGLMTVLQSRKYCTGEFLAERFGMSVRTVYRDIKALNEIGIPVLFENNRGYYIEHGYFLPPLSLTVEEANALILLNTLADKFADHSIVRNSHSAMNKIKSALRYSDKSHAIELSDKIGVYIPEGEKSNTIWLSIIQKALARKSVIRIDYTDANNRKTSREVESVGLIFYTNQWHLYAWCCTRKDYRDFKVNNISDVTDTGKPYSVKKHRTIDDYLKIF